MFALWIKGLITSMQFIVPLVFAVQLLRARTTKDKEEQITRLVVYFMMQSILNGIEFHLGLTRYERFPIKMNLPFYSFIPFNIVKALCTVWMRLPVTDVKNES
jgi:hypothetical protein